MSDDRDRNNIDVSVSRNYFWIAVFLAFLFFQESPQYHLNLKDAVINYVMQHSNK